MPIHRLIQNLSFNQDDIERLAEAYEEALRALHISDRDDPINQIIAQRIIEGARTGVRDPGDLCKMAIKDLMVPWEVVFDYGAPAEVFFLLRRERRAAIPLPLPEHWLSRPRLSRRGCVGKCCTRRLPSSHLHRVPAGPSCEPQDRQGFGL